MPEPMDEFDGWLRQRLAATRRDAEQLPRRRLLLPSVAAEHAVSARRSGFIAGALTTAIVLGMAWGGVTLLQRRGESSRSAGPAPITTPSPSPQGANAGGHVVATITVPDPVFTVAAGAGAVWVPDGRDGTLLRIDPTTNRVAGSIDLGRPPLGFNGPPPAVAISGSAVLVTSPSEQTLVRVDSATDTVTARIPLGTLPDAVAVSDAGTAWVAARQDNEVLRIDVPAGRVAARIPIDGPSFVTADTAAHTVWVVSGQTGVLTRIDTATNRTTHAFTAAPAHDYTLDAASSSGGNALWVRNLDARSVERFDGATRTITDRIGIQGSPPLGFSSPSSIAASGTAVWVVITDALVRVDPTTSQVSRLPLVDPTGIAVDGTTVWVTTAQSTVVRVAAAPAAGR